MTFDQRLGYGIVVDPDTYLINPNNVSYSILIPFMVKKAGYKHIRMCFRHCITDKIKERLYDFWRRCRNNNLILIIGIRSREISDIEYMCMIRNLTNLFSSSETINNVGFMLIAERNPWDQIYQLHSQGIDYIHSICPQRKILVSSPYGEKTKDMICNLTDKNINNIILMLYEGDITWPTKERADLIIDFMNDIKDKYDISLYYIGCMRKIDYNYDHGIYIANAFKNACFPWCMMALKIEDVKNMTISYPDKKLLDDIKKIYK